MSEGGGGLSWFVKALIALGFIATLTGVLLPFLVDSPPWPSEEWGPGKSLLDRLLGE